jgi:predicted nuclease of predicted toxin-antitoxin system
MTTSSDESVIAFASESGRAVLTQDLDFSALIALSGASAPSIVTLRLASARVEHVNAVPETVLPLIEEDVQAGALVTVEDHGIRRRSLPFS